MDVTGISSTASYSGQSGVGVEALASDDFLQVLVAQLSYQDPFEPMGNEEMVNQIANIRELEMNTQLTTRLEQLTEQQRFGSAATMIGKFVKGEVADEDGTTFNIEGVVTAVRFSEKGEALLELDTGQTLPMASLTEVTTVDSTEVA